jgi:uncharacterized membrane protein YgdD (TMEM256/DUF423 family)
MGKNPVDRRWVALGAMFVAIGVAGGAVGTHVVEASGDAEAAMRMETGAHYAVWMGLGQLLLVVLRVERVFLWANLAGVLLFSGLLMAKSLAPHPFESTALGSLIPVGGSILILNWLGLSIRFMLRPPHF